MPLTNQKEFHPKIQSISVVIPVFNEESIIEKSITSLHETLVDSAASFEIITVDDGSSDNSYDILEKLNKKLSYLKIIHNIENRGLGFSLRKAYALAQNELIFYTGADLPIKYNEIQNTVRLLNKNKSDLVIGCRKNRKGDPFYRYIYSFVYNLLISLIFQIKVKDVNSPCKLFKKELIRKLDLKSDGSFIDAELVTRLIRSGHKVSELEVDYFARTSGKSSLARPQVIIKILCEIYNHYKDIMNINAERKQS